MKKQLITTLCASILLSACGTSPSTIKNKNASPTIPMSIVNKAEQLTRNGKATEALELVLPYAQNNDAVAEGLLGDIYNLGLNDKAEAIK